MSSTKYISDFTYEHLHKTDPMLPNARGVHNRKGSALTPYPSPNLVTHPASTHLQTNKWNLQQLKMWMHKCVRKKKPNLVRVAISPAHNKHTKQQRVKATYMLTWGCALFFKVPHLRGQPHKKGLSRWRQVTVPLQLTVLIHFPQLCVLCVCVFWLLVIFKNQKNHTVSH